MVVQLRHYSIKEKIYESNAVNIYRGCSIKKQSLVTIKILNESSISPEKLAKLKWEYKLLHPLKLEHIIRLLALKQEKNLIALVEEYVGGCTLSKIINEKEMMLEDALYYGIEICKALTEIHHLNIIHNAVNPNNIIVNKSEKLLKLINFADATLQVEEGDVPYTMNITQIEGALNYISPEQTGRMNRLVDYRTDFYSLGVVLYQMLTGKLPFQTDDISELIHAHIAKEPLPPHLINHKIPHTLSAIVMKLLSKSADDRYQSAWGIQMDLEQCLNQLVSHNDTDFKLSSYDISEHLIISQKLYGREAEANQLLRCFNEAVEGQSKYVLVTGYSGIGKTSLIQEVYKPMTQKKGVFIRGKFDQYTRSVPYSALTDAFRQLIKNILSEDKRSIEEWGNKIKVALGNNIQLLINLMPELNLILGETHTEPSQENLVKQYNLLNYVLSEFVKIISTQDHPLILFIDDLQWIDTASLSFLTYLMNDDKVKHLLCIFSYRSNEVTAIHPLHKALATLEEEGVVFERISLGPLDEASLKLLLEDTFHNFSEDINFLVKYIHTKTNGNPFFVNQFLKKIYHEKLLEFNIQKLKWSWDNEKIRQFQSTDNVVDLMMENLTKLPVETQRLLNLGACIGGHFDLMTLSIGFGTTLKETYKKLIPAIRAGLILSQSKPELAEKKNLKSALIETNFRFLHDRVQEAAYAFDEKKREHYHLMLGTHLLDNLKEDQIEDSLFQIVDHLNKAENALPRNRLKQTISLNLRAAHKAKLSAAFEGALSYIKRGMSHITLEDWKKDYEQTCALYKERIQLEYVNNNYKETWEYFESALPHIKLAKDQSEFYLVPIEMETMKNNHKKALELGLIALKLAGLDIKLESLHEEVTKLIAIIEKSIHDKGVELFYHLPQIQNKQDEIILALLNSIIIPSYTDNPALRFYVQYKMLVISIQSGRSNYLPRALLSYSLNLNRQYKDKYALGYELAKVGVKIADRDCDSSLKAPVMLILARLTPWRKPLKYTFTLHEESSRLGLSVGNLTIGVSSLEFELRDKFYSGLNLDKVLSEIDNFKLLLNKYNFVPSLHNINTYSNAIKLLKDFTMDNPLISDTALPATFLNDRNTIIPPPYDRVVILRPMIFYLFDEIQKSYKEHMDLDANSLEQIRGEYVIAEYHFYTTLTLCRSIETADSTIYSSLFEKIVSNTAQFKIWAESCPQNFQCMYELLQAEIKRLEGNFIESIKLYNTAYHCATEYHTIQHAALACELQGRLWLHQNNMDLSKLYLSLAADLYHRWGATGKVNFMKDNQYKEALKDYIINKEVVADINANVVSRNEAKNNIDFRTILKASQALSEEISLSSLITTLLSIFAENVGAQRSVLLLKSHHVLQVEGEFDTVSKRMVEFSEPISLEKTTNLPLSIIRYVNQSNETLVLNNVTIDSNFHNDPYISVHKPKSILCAPIIRHKESIGILYFENNLTTDAFTPGRLEVLNTLVQPAAISIENARLYKSLEKFVPHEFLANLNKKSIVDINPGDHIQKDMTIMFTDIRNFTTLSENLTPNETFDLVNNFLAAMNPIIKSCGGFIDKYMGDSIMAIFPNNPNDALSAAIAMYCKVNQLNSEAKISSFPLKIGMGIHTGSMMLGTVGDADHMDGTVISDAVNIASRLEGLTKLYNTPTILSGDLLSHISNREDLELRFLGKIRVKGRVGHIKIYELLSSNDQQITKLKLESNHLFGQALEHFYKKEFTNAYSLFSTIVQKCPQDAIAAIYLKQSEKLQKKKLKDSWSGIIKMKIK